MPPLWQVLMGTSERISKTFVSSISPPIQLFQGRGACISAHNGLITPAPARTALTPRWSVVRDERSYQPQALVDNRCRAERSEKARRLISFSALQKGTQRRPNGRTLSAPPPETGWRVTSPPVGPRLRERSDTHYSLCRTSRGTASGTSLSFRRPPPFRFRSLHENRSQDRSLK